MANPLKPRSQRPYDDNISAATNEWMDWVTSAINQVIGQGNVPSGKGISAPVPNIINPSTAQMSSAGSRPQSLATPITAIPTNNTVSFYWDGTNGSKLLSIYRDDGTTLGPFSGSLVVSGLTPSTTYFFYPFYQETSSITTAFGVNIASTQPTSTAPGIQFVVLSGVSVGTPPVAFAAGNIKAAALQYLRNRIPLSLNFASTGVTTTAGGAGPTVSGGSGGGGAGGGGGRYSL